MLPRSMESDIAGGVNDVGMSHEMMTREMERLRAQNIQHQKALGKMSISLGLKIRRIKELEVEQSLLRGVIVEEINRKNKLEMQILRAENTQRKIELHNLSSALVLKNQKIIDLMTDVIVREMGGKNEQMSATFKTAIDLKNQKIKDLEAEVSLLRGKNEAEIYRRIKLETDKQKAELRKMTAMFELKNQKINELRSEVNKLNELRGKNEEIIKERVRREIQPLRTENVQQKFKLVDMSSDLTFKNGKIKDLEEEVRLLSGNEPAIKRRIKFEAKSCEAENARQKIQLNEMSNDLRNRDRKIKDLVVEVKQLRGKIEEVTKEENNNGQQWMSLLTGDQSAWRRREENSLTKAAGPVPKIVESKPELHIALHAFKARHCDEIDIDVHDIIEIEIRVEPGWNIGKNKRTGKSGMYPANYCEVHK